MSVTEAHTARPLTPSSAGRRPLRVTALVDQLVMGGAQMLLSQFARVAESVDIEFSVTSLGELGGDPAAVPLRAAGVAPICLGMRGRPGLDTLGDLRRHLARTRPDVLHTHLGNADVLGGLAARSLGIPSLSTLHSVEWPPDVELTAKRLVVRACADRLIAVSDAAREAYAARPYGPRRRIVTIHNGVDVAPAPGEGRVVRSQWGWGEGELVVGMVSSLRAEKAHLLALEAVAALRADHPSVRLLIVGEGWMQDAIERRIDELDLGDVVVMAGPREDVMRVYDAFDICLHPSRAEAFPTTILEAMAAGVPVLATAVGGIPEIVRDGVTGRLVAAEPTSATLADAIVDMLASDDLRARMGAESRARYAREFTAGPWARSTRDLYDEVIADRDRRSIRRRFGPRTPTPR